MPHHSEVYLYTFYLGVKLSWKELLSSVCPRLSWRTRRQELEGSLCLP